METKNPNSYAECVFCDIIHAETFVFSERGVCVIEPLNPVTPGHLLFVPLRHEDPTTDLGGVAQALNLVDLVRRRMRNMDQLPNFNLILNGGPDATQTIQHAHLHYVPRVPGDGLILPWTNQIKKPVV